MLQQSTTQPATDICGSVGEGSKSCGLLRRHGLVPPELRPGHPRPTTLGGYEAVPLASPRPLLCRVRLSGDGSVHRLSLGCALSLAARGGPRRRLLLAGFASAAMAVFIGFLSGAPYRWPLVAVLAIFAILPRVRAGTIGHAILACGALLLYAAGVWVTL